MVVAGHACVNGQVAATISDVQFVATGAHHPRSGQSTVCTEEQVADIKAEISLLEHELRTTVEAINLDMLRAVAPTPTSDGRRRHRDSAQGRHRGHGALGIFDLSRYR